MKLKVYRARSRSVQDQNKTGTTEEGPQLPLATTKMFVQVGLGGVVVEALLS